MGSVNSQMHFMNLPKEYRTKDSLFYILPIEYEGNLTYGQGASNGSYEIIKASHHLEYYDEQFDIEPFVKGIYTLECLNLKNIEPENAVKEISKEAAKHKDKFLISLGGDHSITIGTVKGLDRLYKDFSIIILDAHSDFFHSWNNSQYNHRCVSQRLSENHKIFLIGVRSMDADEAHIIKNNENISLIKAYDFSYDKLKQTLKNADKKVYISIDADVFDPCFIRNTGTPEPGGFFWHQIINLLKIIFETKEVIGADIVEFSPKYNFRAEAFALAKLVYKIMGLCVFGKK